MRTLIVNKICRNKIFIILLLIILSLVIVAHKYLAKRWPTANGIETEATTDDELTFTATNSDNITGFGRNIVPNTVHYVRLENPYIDFVALLSIKSVLKNHGPNRIIIHCDCDSLRGKYWSQLVEECARDYPSVNLTVRTIARPESIFGKKLSSVYHSSDIARLEILMSFGGIFLDNDVFVVKSLHPFRRFEFSIGWPPNESLGTQILIGHKNARFLRLWYESYRHYRPTRWYYNAGELPSNDILTPNPGLVHRVPHAFGVHNLVPMLYNDSYPFWETKFYAIHLLARHRSYLVPNDPIVYFDENNIKTYNKTFGEMARSVFYGTKNIIV